MREHFQALPADHGFPTAEDMRRWRAAFEDLVPSGNPAELIGFMRARDGEMIGVCRFKNANDG